MNTRQLYYLATIAEKSSLSAAAQALAISQPTLSRFLTKLESELGIFLFERHYRELVPTAIGQEVIQYAQKILDEQNRMLMLIKEVSGGKLNRIRLATAPNRGAIIFSKIYNEFSRRYPGISLQLTELYASDQANAISRGQIDLALGSGEISDRVTDIPIAREMLLVSLPASHPLAKQASVQIKALRDTPFVLQGPRHSIRIMAEKIFSEAGFYPVVVFESNDVILVDSMMHQAVGAGFVSKAHVFPCDELVYLPMDPPLYQTLHIRYPLGHTLTAPERYLAGLLIRERLSDPRYSAINTPEAEALYIDALDQEELPNLDEKNTSRFFKQQQRFISLDTKVMEFIIAIVEEQGLGAAAQRFFLAQPALSRHLRNVERTVGVPLFTREHNRLRPTSAGAVFVNNSRNILRLEGELTRKIQSSSSSLG